MAFVAGAVAAGMELLEVIGGGLAVAEAAADVTAAAEAIAMEEAVPLMETAVGRTVTGAATRSFAAYSSAARAGSIARALGASGLVASAVTGAVSARSFKKAEDKMERLFGLGKRKRGADPDAVPLLPAQPTRPGIGTTTMPVKRAKTRKRALKKRSQVKRVKRTASKKTKPKKKGPSRSKLTAYENHGVLQRDDVSYFGFQNTCGRDELLRAACEAMLKALLRKFRIQVRSPDETLFIAQSVPAVNIFTISYRKRSYQYGTDAGAGTTGTFDLDGGTYKSVVDAMETSVKTQAAAGYFPYRMQAYNKNGAGSADNEVMRDNKFGDAKLSLAVSRRIKLRNITPNDGNGTDRFALDTNPLQGCLYKFRGDTPVVKEGLYDTSREFYAKFHDKDCFRGIAFGPQRNTFGNHGGVPDPASAIMGDDKVLSTPPRNGKTIWSNCVSSMRFEMQPGQAVAHMMKFTYTGSFVSFLHKYYGDQYKPPTIGSCHWFGLEQKFKNKLKAASGQHTASEHDHIVVEYDIDSTISGGMSFAAAAKAPRAVITDIINSVPA